MFNSEVEGAFFPQKSQCELYTVFVIMQVVHSFSFKKVSSFTKPVICGKSISISTSQLVKVSVNGIIDPSSNYGTDA